MRYLIVLFLISSCSTPLPYQSATDSNGNHRGGYVDSKIGDSVFHINIQYSGKMPKKIRHDYLHRRAAELCEGSTYSILDSGSIMVNSSYSYFMEIECTK